MSVSAKRASEVQVGDSIFVLGYFDNIISKPETVVEVAPASTTGWVVIKTNQSEAHYQEGASIEYVVPGPVVPVWSWDADVSAGYLTLQDGEVSYTREVAPCVMIDYDIHGNALGVEVL